jgi:transcriptional regulator with XRE-family HTH domain
MGVVGKNVRKIRTVKKLSQASFAELFNLARPSVGAYEEGRSEPKLETIIQIANYFGISIDSLLTKELTINDLYNFNLHLDSGSKPGVQNTRQEARDRLLIRSVLVPAAEAIEYIVHLNNRDFVAKLPKILIPGFHSDHIRAFEMDSDDMHDNFHGVNVGDLVLGRKLSAPHKFAKGALYIIVSNEKIVIRRVKPLKDRLELVPDNGNFQSISVARANILEAWEVVGYFSQKIEAPTLVSERIMHLENQYHLFNKRLMKLERDKK